jgi:hypothetical protein
MNAPVNVYVAPDLTTTADPPARSRGGDGRGAAPPAGPPRQLLTPALHLAIGRQVDEARWRARVGAAGALPPDTLAVLEERWAALEAYAAGRWPAGELAAAEEQYTRATLAMLDEDRLVDAGRFQQLAEFARGWNAQARAAWEGRATAPLPQKSRRAVRRC